MSKLIDASYQTEALKSCEMSEATLKLIKAKLGIETVISNERGISPNLYGVKIILNNELPFLKVEYNKA